MSNPRLRRHPVKLVAGEQMVIQTDIVSKCHEKLGAARHFRRQGDHFWQEVTMQRLDNDRWQGAFALNGPGLYD